MDWWMYMYVTIVGFILGSFYNVIGIRVPIKKSILFPYSSCALCQKRLTPIELIPVLSYFMLGGKCKHCKGPILLLYPCMELITGSLFVLSPIVIGWEKELVICYALISLLIIVTVSDLVYMIIPDKILLCFFVLFIILDLYIGEMFWVESIVGGIIGFGMLLFMAFVSNGGMGGGDIKLFGLLGFVLGTKNIILTFFFSVLLGGVVGIVFLLLGIFKKKQAIPFGPFISIGALLSYYFGEQIVNWYFGVIV